MSELHPASAGLGVPQGRVFAIIVLVYMLAGGSLSEFTPLALASAGSGGLGPKKLARPTGRIYPQCVYCGRVTRRGEQPPLTSPFMQLAKVGPLSSPGRDTRHPPSLNQMCLSVYKHL